jgi:hypothetical protein
MVVFPEETRRLEMTQMGVLKFVFTLWIAFQLLVNGASAADQLQVDLTPLGMRARNEAPIPVEARFEWDSTRILEGRLEMAFHEGNRVLGRYRSGDLALTGGEQKFRMLLPPSLTPFSDSQIEVRMKFVTAGGVIDLEPSVLFEPTVGERSLVVGWCDTVAAGQPSSDAMQNLLFERFAPPSDNNRYQRWLMTSVVRLAPEDLPAQPLDYTAFDVVVLTAEAFQEAGERQLQTLARWVRGGGSVCVFVGGELQPHQVAFLNQLAHSLPDGPLFLSDGAGNLLSPQENLLFLRSGVGRSVIVTGKKAVALSLDTTNWRKAATFLWKMRRSEARAIMNSGHWESPTNASMEENSTVPAALQPRNVRNFAKPLSYSMRPTTFGVELLGRLMPATVRLIPFSALMGTLVLFVLLIGPADYFVLGFFRRRRLTWVLFPATSIAFTVAMVLMANHYLGLRDQRRSLIVVDLDRDGTALRWNRYELVFAARDKQSVTELKDALWAPLNVQVLAQPGLYFIPYNRSYGYRGDAAHEAGPPLYDGAVPVHFQIREVIHQWQPELNRIFSFEPPSVPMPANWRAIEAAWPNLHNIRAKLAEGKFSKCDVCVISPPNPNIGNSGPGGVVPAPAYSISRRSSAVSPIHEILPDSILSRLCVADSAGLQTLVSQVSPTGGGNFEDAPAMDPEADDSVLAIVTQFGDDIVVYRRFFYGN